MLDALTLDQMRTFVAVAEAGSFRAGAERLSRAQSAASHAIGMMEAELGVALFDRSGYRPDLTPEGRVLLEDARAILLKVDLMRARAHGLGEGVEVELPIVVDTLFPLPIVGAALASLHEIHPSLSVSMRTAPLGEPLSAVRDGRCTLAITVGENFRDPRIEVEALSSLPVVAVAAATHPLAGNGKVLGTGELAEYVQIVLQDPTPLSEGRDFGVLSPRSWRVNSQETKQALILAGIGWGRLPLWSVERELAEGRLVRIDTPALGPGGQAMMTAYLARRNDRPFGPAARALRSELLRRV